MRFILILALLLLVPDLYIWYSVVDGAGVLWSILHFVPSLAIIAVIVMGMTRSYPGVYMKIFFYMLLLVAVPKMLFTIISLVGRLVSIALPAALAVGNVVGGAAAAITVVAVVYGLVEGWRHVVIREKSLAFDDLPQGVDGYRIVHLSDLHIGTYKQSPSTVDKIVEMVNGLYADVILFTGDLVNSHPSELDMFMTALSLLKARDGVYSVLGNHDYCEYHRYDTADGQYKAVQELIARERKMGWKLLLNENAVITRDNDSIAIIGVENDGRPPFPSRGDLRKAQRNLPNGIFKILLSHDPSHWLREVMPKTDIQLTMSGHTHAMQLKIGRWSPSSFTYKEWGGVYEREGRHMHVSTGTGGNVAFRLGAWPEIDVIELKRK